MKYNNSSGNWENSLILINEISDVNITSLQNGEVLKFNNSSGRWENANNTDTLDELSDVVITSIQNNNILKYNSTSGNFVNTFVNLTELADTNITSLTNGDILRYNSGNTAWETSTFTINDLDDVNITSVANNQVLKYNSSSSKWENSERIDKLDELDDVTLTSVTNNDLLIFNGTNFVNSKIALDNDFTNVNFTSLTTNDLIKYDGTNFVNFSPTYLTQANASSTYLTQSNASSTYLPLSTAASTYLTQSNASSTYLTQWNAVFTYLTQANASSTYLPISTASSTYLTQANASSTYLTQTTAASTYFTQASAVNKLDAIRIQTLTSSSSPSLAFLSVGSIIDTSTTESATGGIPTLVYTPPNLGLYVAKTSMTTNFGSNWPVDMEGNIASLKAGAAKISSNIYGAYWAAFSHSDKHTDGNYALIQGAAGQTLLNTSTNQLLEVRMNNSTTYATFFCQNAVDTNGTFKINNYGFQSLPGVTNTTVEARIMFIQFNGIAYWWCRNSANQGGLIPANNLVSTFYPSDDRLKFGEEPITNGIETIKLLKPTRYKQVNSLDDEHDEENAN